MKSILLAAAAVIAFPAIAQETPQTTPPATEQAAPADQTMTPDAAAPDATAPADPAAPATAPAAPTAADPMSAPPAAQAPMTPTTGDAATPPMGAPATGATPATETSGGYQPSGPATSGPVQPGATVRVQPSMSPSQAFPPPAAKESYPICKKGQYDGCMQASDARGAKRARR
ncbi:hypothetical protein ASG29_08225 [Sphingomonas sp. Leaf412]|uniref:hypothetical protein n=1 Tax=Sphingomonas sp. Leaf412 TaxID=1736370 RepID=UPI0006FE5E71|nr:hypothetical protein [Sphingomonas sp. Leaf412]KQT32880.1 hypothetical protein ASG29_08225 [Sphingomonas sp. Leaf412]